MRTRPGLIFLTLSLLSALAMSGCATRAGEASYSPGEAVTMRPGATLDLPGGAQLRYVEVVADSRCPPGVQCIRAGAAKVRFELRPGGGGSQSAVLVTDGRRSAALGGWRIELLELDSGPAPPATIRVQAAQP